MLFERISVVIPVFLILAGFIFAYLAEIRILTTVESVGLVLGIFIINSYNEIRGSYAAGNI
jgi:hypothetical protein